jgi:hypothetical protein
MNLEMHLRLAAGSLPDAVALWTHRAVRSGWFPLGHGSYDGATVCPIAAGAKLAGIWEDGAIASGHPDWGDPDRPSEEVEEFAAWFDLVAEDEGLGRAINIAQGELDRRSIRRSALAA